MKYFFSVLTILNFASCQKVESVKTEHKRSIAGSELNLSSNDSVSQFRNLLSKGKVIHHGEIQNVEDEGILTFDHGVITKKQFSALGGELNWVLYNTEKMPVYRLNELKNAALKFLEDKKDEFLIDVNELNYIGQKEIKNQKMIVSFNRMINGKVLTNSYLDLVFSADRKNLYRLGEVDNKTAGGLPVEQIELKEISDKDLLNQLGVDGEILSKNEVYRIIDVNGAFEIQNVWEIKVQDVEMEEKYTITLDGSDHQILEAFSNKVFEKEHQINARLLKRNYLDLNNGLESKPLSFINITGNSFNGTTDGLGLFSKEDTLNDIQMELSSKWVRVFDTQQSLRTPVSISVSLSGDDVTTIPETINNFRALNAYMAIMNIGDFVQKFIKKSDTQYLRQPVNLTINVSGSCNAFYDGAISLFSAGNQGGLACANMAEVNDVIYHEWGHGLDNFTGRNGGGIGDGAFSEGIGDIVSAYYLNSSVMAPGFALNQNNGIRSLANNKKYPGDLTGEVHDDGEIIAGTFWDLRKELIIKYGEERGAHKAADLFFNHLLQVDSYTESYQAIVRLDDEDGNPATRSENYCIINKVFANRGLAQLESNCVDVPEDKELLDDSVHIGISSEDQSGNLYLMASGNSEIRRIIVCNDERLKCLVENKNDGELNLIFEDQKNYFLSSEPMAINEHDALSFIALDQYGKVIGSQRIRFTLK